MINNFKDIHIGKMIRQRVNELEVDISRICSFFKCSEIEVEFMYTQESINADLLLKWSKLLEYDFFRIYSHHLILYAPAAGKSLTDKKAETGLPQFKKNLYTQEIIDFILEMISSGHKSKNQVISEYGIPKTTLYKWLVKYNKSS